MGTSLRAMAITLDTLAYAKRLREAGFSEQQAEEQAQALAAAMTDERFADLEHRTTLRLGAMTVAGLGVVSVLATLF